MEVERLSNCELDVMKTFWEADGPLTILEIKDRLEREKSREYARTTIATWLLRLKKKAYVKAQMKEGNAYYEAVLQQDVYERMEVRLLAERLFKGALPKFVAAYGEANQVTEADVREIKEIMDGWDY